MFKSLIFRKISIYEKHQYILKNSINADYKIEFKSSTMSTWEGYLLKLPWKVFSKFQSTIQRLWWKFIQKKKSQVVNLEWSYDEEAQNIWMYLTCNNEIIDLSKKFMRIILAIYVVLNQKEWDEGRFL